MQISRFFLLFVLLTYAFLASAFVEVTIISPPDFFTTNEAKIKCRGVLESAADILISKLGTNTKTTKIISADSFDIDVPLDSGANTIAIEIYKGNSKPQVFERRVYRHQGKQKSVMVADKLWQAFPSISKTPRPTVQVIQSRIEPKTISIADQTIFDLQIQISNSELVKEITADLSDLGWSKAGNVRFKEADQGWYIARGIILAAPPVGVLRIPGIIKLYNGESLFTEFIAWVAP